jgi:uncharacterized protein YndB with AHSA1/START domain
MHARAIVAGALVGVLVASTRPALAQDDAHGFVVRDEVNIAAPLARVYDVLVDSIGSWWSSEHTFSGDANNLSIDARPGGCFCERLPNGGGVEHLRVVYVAPRHLLRMTGALGPLQGSGLAGSLTLQLSGVPGGTNLQLTYSVGGFWEGGFSQIAPAVKSVLGGQLQRLKRFVETGSPTEGEGSWR